MFLFFFIQCSKKDWLSLKGKKPLKIALIIGILFIYGIVPIIAFGLDETLPLAIQNMYLSNNKKRNQKILKNYSYLPLLSAGVNLDNEELLVPSFREHTELLDKFYQEGLLLFKLTDSTRNRLHGNEYEKDYSSNEIWISPEYLTNSFVEILDIHGKKISIKPDKKELTILIPEQFEDDLQKVKEYYIQSHNFYDFDVAQEFSKEVLKKETKQIKFILIKNNPKLLFFRTSENKLKNPIFRVLTQNNIQKETSIYADVILGQTDYFFVKNNGNLEQIINKYDKYGEFPVQISAYDYLMSTMNEDVHMMGIFLIIVSGLVFLYYIISYFLSSVFIEIYDKKIKLAVLFGFSLKKIILFYLSFSLTPWLSILFFHPTKQLLLLILCITIGNSALTIINFMKIYRNITKLD